MKTLTVDQLLLFSPCYGEERIREIAGDKAEWSALDILHLTNVPAKDRLWAVLRMRLIDGPILHEFACQCAESALALIDNPDPRSIAAIAAKRAWLRGEINHEQLHAAAYAAAAAGDVAYAAYAAAAYAADAAAAAAAYTAAAAAADAAAYAADAAAADADAAAAAARGHQADMLIKLLEGEI